MDQSRFVEAQRFLLAQAASLRAYLHMLLGNVHDAEDVLQDAFVKYLRVGPADSDQARRWMFAVCRNGAMDLLRSQRRRTTSERDSATAWPAPAADPADQVEQRDSEDRISRCLARLPEDLREMVYLKFAEELSLAEIAQRTAVPRSTVALRVQQGLVMLNRCFHGGGHD